MKPKYPKSLTDAIAQIKELRKVSEGMNEFNLKLVRERDEARANSREFEREAKATREQFADLKERLANAERETARLSGYMERVREDDAVADPLVEIEGPEGKRLVSKRHPSPHYDGSYFDKNALMDSLTREKRKHWTSY